MTVSAHITNPQNEFERKFTIPIATEKFFYDYWMVGIEAQELPWMLQIAPGLHVQEEILPDLWTELEQLKTWFELNVQGEDAKAYFFRRAKLLKDKLPTAFQRKDAVVHIG